MAKKIEKKQNTRTFAQMKKNKTKHEKLLNLPAGEHSVKLSSAIIEEKVIDANVSKQRPEIKVIELFATFKDVNGYGYTERRSYFDYDFNKNVKVSLEQWENRFFVVANSIVSLLPDDTDPTIEGIQKALDKLIKDETPIYLHISPNTDPFTGKITKFVEIDLLDD